MNFEHSRNAIIEQLKPLSLFELHNAKTSLQVYLSNAQANHDSLVMNAGQTVCSLSIMGPVWGIMQLNALEAVEILTELCTQVYAPALQYVTDLIAQQEVEH